MSEAEKMLDGILKREDFGEPSFRMERRRAYLRYEDMSPFGSISLYMQDDGDIIVHVVREDDTTRTHEMAQVEFCTIGSGGGQSGRVRDALIKLAEAIELDNKDRPQYRREGGAT